ncbi:MAG: hypothetical protein ACR2P8_05620, partial [Myxococcota bacterium]
MNVLHLLTLAVLLAASIAACVVMVRTGDTRVALLAALFLLLGIPVGTAWWTQPPAAPGLDLATAAAAAGLAAALLGLVSVLVLRRTLLDLD